MTASRTTPTLCVFVIITGPPRNPDSSTHVVPVISPFPLSVNHPANASSSNDAFPRGRMAVTPVRTGPTPTFSGPSPEISVVWPTSTPFTSVMAFSFPGVPSNGTPKSRARGLVWAATPNTVQKTATHTHAAERLFGIQVLQIRSVEYKAQLQLFRISTEVSNGEL